MRPLSISKILLILASIDLIDPNLWIAEGVIPPTKQSAPRFSSLKIHSNIRYRLARTIITGELSNPASKVEDITWDVILPAKAFVSNFTAIINGKHFHGEVVRLDKNQAQPKHKVMRPPGTAAFSLQLQSPSKSQMTLILCYEQLLERQLGQYEQEIYFIPGQDMDTLDIRVDIEETNAILKIKVPPMIGSKSSARIDKSSARAASIKYTATKTQLQQLSENPTAKFSVQYDVARADDGGNFLLSNGFFVHYFGVEAWPALPLDIVFVLDVSGSMFQNGINQMKTAMKKILSKLGDNDRLGIVVYNMNVESWKDKMVRVTEETIQEAWNFIDGQTPFGRSNINDALLQGLSLLEKSSLPSSSSRAMTIFFLTDGDASEGVTRTSKIIENVQEANQMQIPIHSVLIGDASFQLSRQLSLSTHGLYFRIYSPEQLISELEEFYDRISNVVAKNLRFKYADQLVEKTSRTYFKVYHKGSELVIAGKCRPGSRNLTPSVSLVDSNGEKKLKVSPNSYSQDNAGDVAERVFALLSIKDLMEPIVVRQDPNEDSLQNKMAEIAMKYHYLTDVTSLKVSNQGSSLGSGKSENVFHSNGRVYGIHGGYGGGGGDPHFIMDITGLNIPICFNIISHSGQVLTLVDDPSTRIKVTASVVTSVASSANHLKSYMGEIRVIAPGLNLTVTPHSISANSRSVKWTSESVIKLVTSDLTSHGNGKMLSVRIGNEVRFLLKRVIRKDNLAKTKRLNFLDFYITDRRGLSIKTKGVVGSLVHVGGYMRWTRKSLDGKMKGHLVLYNRHKWVRTTLMAVLKERPDPITERKPCWMLWKNSYKQLRNFEASKFHQKD